MTKQPCKNHKRYSTKCVHCRTLNSPTVADDVIETVIQKIENMPARKPRKTKKLPFVPCRADIQCGVCR